MSILRQRMKEDMAIRGLAPSTQHAYLKAVERQTLYYGKRPDRLSSRGIRITIPHKVNEHRSGPFDRAIYRLREQVERLINRLKQHRRVATRYEKCAANYRAMWLIAATLLWLEC